MHYDTLVLLETWQRFRAKEMRENEKQSETKRLTDIQDNSGRKTHTPGSGANSSVA